MLQIIKVFVTIFIVLVVGYGALNLVGQLIVCAMRSEDRDYYEWSKGFIWAQDDHSRIYYQEVQMSFEKWKGLFELDPTQFQFLDKNKGTFLDLRDLDHKFRKSHPAFKDKDNKYYVIDFKGREYSRYWDYEDELVAKLSSIHEDQITKYIVGDIQDKLDAIIDESQAQIQRSLKLQDEIVLRLQEDVKEK